MDVIDRIRATLAEKAGSRGIEFGGRWSSWGDVARYGNAIEALLEAAGVPPGGRVAVIIRNRAAHAAAVVGLLAHRRSPSFVYPFLPPAALAEQVETIGVAAVIADEDEWPLIADAARRVGSAGIAIGAIEGAPRLVEGLERSRIAHDDEAGEGAIEVLSSGTTGPPKRIVMPMHLLDRAVQSAPGAESDGPPPVQINIWPLGGVGGVCLLSAAAAHGTPLVLIERFSVDELVSAIERHRPPALGLSPTALRMLYEADVPREALASFTAVSGGSAHLDPDLQDAFEEKYGIPIYWAMGATEFCGTIVRWTPQMRAAVGSSKRGSIGQAMTGVDLRIADPETGALLPPGSEGLLEVHCPAVRPDWVRTTDLAVIDEDGFVFHRGRHDGAIVRGGFKILPERVVEVLRAHPAVGDAAVVGLPDERLGMVPAAAVELRAGRQVDAAELTAFLRERLPPTHVPARILVVDALPRTPSLKASLGDVRRMFETEPA